MAPDGVWVESALGVEWVMVGQETYGDVIRTEVAIKTGNTSYDGKPGVSKSVKPGRSNPPYGRA